VTQKFQVSTRSSRWTRGFFQYCRQRRPVR